MIFRIFTGFFCHSSFSESSYTERRGEDEGEGEVDGIGWDGERGWDMMGWDGERGGEGSSVVGNVFGRVI
jgi:hypothetical protein